MGSVWRGTTGCEGLDGRLAPGHLRPQEGWLGCSKFGEHTKAAPYRLLLLAWGGVLR